jgi:hypothetical protein
MIRLLRSCGFLVEDLIEIQAPSPAHREYDEVSRSNGLSLLVAYSM